MAKVTTKISAGSSAPGIAEYLVGRYKSVGRNPNHKSKKVTRTSVVSGEFEVSAISRASN